MRQRLGRGALGEHAFRQAANVLGRRDQTIHVAGIANGAGNGFAAAALQFVDVFLRDDADQLFRSVDHDHVMHAVARHHQRRLVDGGAPVEHQQPGAAHHRHDQLVQIARALRRDPMQQVAQREDADRTAALGFDDDDGTDTVFRHRLHGFTQGGIGGNGDRLAANQRSQLAVQGKAGLTGHDEWARGRDARMLRCGMDYMPSSRKVCRSARCSRPACFRLSTRMRRSSTFRLSGATRLSGGWPAATLRC